MSPLSKTPFDEESYAFVVGEMSGEASDAYRKRLQADDELASWVALVRCFVDGCLGAPESVQEKADSSILADHYLASAVNTGAIANTSDETLDAQKLNSLSQILHRSDTSPVAQAWQRLTKIFEAAELQAYWEVVVERHDPAKVASRLGLEVVDVEIYVSQVARQLERELEPV